MLPIIAGLALFGGAVAALASSGGSSRESSRDSASSSGSRSNSSPGDGRRSYVVTPIDPPSVQAAAAVESVRKFTF